MVIAFSSLFSIAISQSAANGSSSLPNSRNSWEKTKVAFRVASCLKPKCTAGNGSSIRAAPKSLSFLGVERYPTWPSLGWGKTAGWGGRIAGTLFAWPCWLLTLLLPAVNCS